MTRLALFDLDHTLLSGDSDVLWCEFLIDRGLLDRTEFESRNRAMAERYAQGLATPAEFSGFYAQTFAGVRPGDWQVLRERFHAAVVVPRIPAPARELVERHRQRGDRLLLTTATSRYLTELTAQGFGIADLIATELEIDAGIYTGRTTGTPNMREGKIERLRDWLVAQRLPASVLVDATFYSDSANDLPLLRSVGHPVAVDPDAVLEACAREQGWTMLRLVR